jgi:DNA-directed RNA polymerase specialized sigma subunit
MLTPEIDHPQLASLRAQVRRERKARTIHATALRERNRMLLRAIDDGVMSQAKLGELCGISKQRVEQLVKAERERLALEAEKARRLDGVFDEVRIYFQEEKAR